MGKRGDRRRKREKEERKLRQSQVARRQPEPAPIESPPQETIPRWRRVSGRVKAVVAGVVAVAAAGVTFGAYNPQLNASEHDVINPVDPTSAHVTITNGGWYTLKDVVYSCIQVAGVEVSGKVGVGNPPFRMNRIDNNVDRRWIGVLEGGQAATVVCDDMIEFEGPGLVVTLDFVVQVWFRPWFVPRWVWSHQSKPFHFVAVPGADHRFHVERQPPVPLSDMLMIDPPWLAELVRQRGNH